MSRINNGGNGNVLGSDQRLFAATTAGGSTEKYSIFKNILPQQVRNIEPQNCVTLHLRTKKKHFNFPLGRGNYSQD